MNATCFHCGEKHDTMDEFYICATNHGFKRHTTPTASPSREMRPVKPTEERRDRDRRQLLNDIRRVGGSVPEGRYALRNHGTPNDITFLRVTKGRNGSTFVRQLLSDEEHNLSWERQLNALVRIAADVEGAMRLFGQKTVRCGHCGRRLTNQESRERGIGPVCAKGMGFAA